MPADLISRQGFQPGREVPVCHHDLEAMLPSAAPALSDRPHQCTSNSRIISIVEMYLPTWPGAAVISQLLPRYDRIGFDRQESLSNRGVADSDEKSAIVQCKHFIRI